MQVLEVFYLRTYMMLEQGEVLMRAILVQIR